jgi:hypothetical protein
MPRGQVRRKIRKRNYRAARRDRKERNFMFGNKKGKALKSIANSIKPVAAV